MVSRLRAIAPMLIALPFASAACGGGDQVPNDPPTISDFHAEPDAVRAGQTTVLKYSVSNAETVKIEIVGGAALLSDSTALQGMVTTPVLEQTTSFRLSASRGAELATKMLTVGVGAPQAASVVRFTATPAMVDRGVSSTLAWETTGAVSGELRDESGALILDIAPANLATGGHTIENIQMSRAITLAVTGADGIKVERTVMIALEGPEISAFTASPQTIELGDEVTLSWNVARADSVSITGSVSGEVVTNDPMPTGSKTLRPAISESYTLVARDGAGRQASATAAVTVTPGAPAILSFSATPNPTAINSTVMFAWTALGAESVRIVQGGNELFATSTNPNSGTFATIVAATTTFVLEARNALGVSSEALVVAAHELPIIHSFTVSPTGFSTPTSPALLAWNVSSASRLEILANSVPLAGFTPIDTGEVAGQLSGTFPTTVSQTTVFELIARSGAGEVRQSVVIASAAVETEPNDDASNAMVILGDGAPVTAEIGAPSDVDYYAFMVPEGGNVRAETSDGLSACAIDTVLTLFDSSELYLTDDDDGGFSPCSLIDPELDVAAADLPAGIYYLTVEHYDFDTGTGPYTLNVTVGSPSCGNAIVETRAATPEDCDDGNTVDGDGCDGTCNTESLASLTGPNGQEVTISGAISAVGEFQLIEIEMLSDGYIRAESFAPQAPDCTNTDTYFQLINGDFTAGIGQDENDGVGNCSLIDPLVDSWALLPTGRYWLVVHESGGNSTIPAFTVVVRLLELGCGNGIIESGETCDDANTSAGDGCDASCATEITSEDEAAGNDSFDEPGVLTATPNAVFAGRIQPIGDADWYAVVVPDGYHLDAYATTDSFSTCSALARAGVSLFGVDGTTELATDIDHGPNALCGRISPDTAPAAFSMAAGTYYLRVAEVGNDAELLTYELHVRAVAPGCGNAFVEGTEICDDGNTSSGDGCSGTCSYEINPLVISPPANRAFVPLSTPTAFGVVQLEVTTAGQSIFAVSGDFPNGLTCDFIDTSLELLDSSFALIGSESGTGVVGAAGTCANIHPQMHSFATDLDIGTYYIAVRNEDQSGTGAVDLAVAINDPECGNAILESRAGEACDDGNQTNGDGCSGGCAIEP